MGGNGSGTCPMADFGPGRTELLVFTTIILRKIAIPILDYNTFSINFIIITIICILLVFACYKFFAVGKHSNKNSESI